MVLFGCITPEYIPYYNSSRESKEENFVVKVYNREQLIGNDYEIIGEISVEGCSCEIEKMLNESKKRRGRGNYRSESR